MMGRVVRHAWSEFLEECLCLMRCIIRRSYCLFVICDEPLSEPPGPQLAVTRHGRRVSTGVMASYKVSLKRDMVVHTACPLWKPPDG